MTVCVFLGPSLPMEEAGKHLDAVYLPPARRGDVLGAVRTYQPSAIALIDGYFEQQPSVWHKELLWALDRGVALYGAASMGALRAAELAQFGMVGMGRIYQAYAAGRFAPFDNIFEDDDEVAVVHGPADIGYPASDAMVDIRAVLAAAEAVGAVSRADMHRIAHAAKTMFYKHRTWSALLLAARQDGVPDDALDAFRDWLRENRFSQKRLDAEALLRHLKDGAAHPPPPAFRFERTLLWEDAIAASDREGEE